MADVELYRKIPGIPNSGPNGAYDDPLNYVFSHHEKVKAKILSEVETRSAIAKAKLAAHRDTGASSIGVQGGAVDYYVSLIDTDPESAGGRKNASVLSIEFGGKSGRGGVAPLRTAFPEIG